jgi:hypothetical protein
MGCRDLLSVPPFLYSPCKVSITWAVLCCSMSRNWHPTLKCIEGSALDGLPPYLVLWAFWCFLSRGFCSNIATRYKVGVDITTWILDAKCNGNFQRQKKSNKSWRTYSYVAGVLSAKVVAKEECCFDVLMSSYLVGTKHSIYKLR